MTYDYSKLTKDQMWDPANVVKWLPDMFSQAIQTNPIPLKTSSVVVSNSVVVGTTSSLILDNNPNRLGFMLYNNSANSRYFTFGPQSNSNSSCSLIVPTFANWVWPYSSFCYTGQISAIGNAGTGRVVITEFI